MEAVANAGVFFIVKLETRLALFGRVDHHFQQTLSDNRRAEHDADELVDLGCDLRVESNELEVAAAVATFADHALRNTVERSQFYIVIFSRRFFLQLTEALLEGCELADEDIRLVDFVCHYHELFLCSQVENVLDIIRAQGGAGGVTRVDDHNCTNFSTFSLGLQQ